MHRLCNVNIVLHTNFNFQKKKKTKKKKKIKNKQAPFQQPNIGPRALFPELAHITATHVRTRNWKGIPSLMQLYSYYTNTHAPVTVNLHTLTHTHPTYTHTHT